MGGWVYPLALRKSRLRVEQAWFGIGKRKNSGGVYPRATISKNLKELAVHTTCGLVEENKNY
jgi:hypothetical protein